MKIQQQMVLASRLRDGRAAFLTREGNWSVDIASGAVADDPEQAAALLVRARQDEQRNLVVDPYLVDVRIIKGRPSPVDWRERIRAEGPTTTV
ncbi:MAG: DUF2849 domain-containing protein [Chromatiales bacterium]|nr:DUF2849 domain-containing protein [Chromatiales bacterium]